MTRQLIGTDPVVPTTERVAATISPDGCQAISQHLAVLEDACLVTTERRGRCKVHYFNSEPLAVISQRWLLARKDTV